MATIDKAKILRGDDIVLNDVITLSQPSLNEIIDYGEQKFFHTFYTICGIPSDMKSVLWDSGLDWNKVTDWQFFIMITRDIHKEDTSLIIKGIDFSVMQPMKNVDNEEIVLTDGNLIITESMYIGFISYIRAMIGYMIKREKAGNKWTRQILIDEDRKKRSETQKEFESIINPMIISLVNTEEFFYSYKTVYEITIYQLMKSFLQIQNKKSACALYQGSMSGFVDTSKINKNSFSWIYDEAKLK